MYVTGKVAPGWHDKPSHRQLYMYAIKEVAPHWYNLGVQLLKEESVYMLKSIKENHPNNVQKCCSEMFDYWLRTDTNASWNTLIVALEQSGQNALAVKIKRDVLKGILSTGGNIIGGNIITVYQSTIFVNMQGSKINVHWIYYSYQFCNPACICC